MAGLIGVLWLQPLAGCKNSSPDVPMVTRAASPAAEPSLPPIAAALQAAPWSELAFVPYDSEAVLRVDLVKLTDGDDRSAEALDFVLRAQQTAAWEVLRAAGIRPGRELRAIYLVVGPRTPKARDGTQADSFLIAGVGTFDRARVIDGLTRSGASVEPAPGGGAMFIWTSGGEKQIGAALPPGNQPLGRVALGVAEELLLLGPPELVQRALTARAGGGKDVRRSTSLAAELLAVNPEASAWGVASVPTPGAYLRELWPGLERGRFSTTIAHGSSMNGKGAVDLRAEFATAEDAERFSADARRMLGQIGALADSSPVGATLSRMRELGLTVDGKVVVAGH